MYLEFKATLFILLTFVLIYKLTQFLLEDFGKVFHWKVMFLISFAIITYFFIDIVKETYPLFRLVYFISPLSILFSSFYFPFRRF